MDSEHKTVKIITVGGMIGVGKTTKIMEMQRLDLENGLKSKIVYELFEDVDSNIFREKTTRDTTMDLFLKLYYDNVGDLQSPHELDRHKALGVTLGHQTNFLATRAGKIIEAIQIAKEQELDVLYLDRTIFEDIIFTKRNLFNEPLYWETYHPIWEMWYNMIQYHMKDCDVENIILDAPLDVILKRIKGRGREMEQSEELTQYFTDLNESYVSELRDNFILKGQPFTIINNGGD